MVEEKRAGVWAHLSQHWTPHLNQEGPEFEASLIELEASLSYIARSCI